ncbi:hypothetical protein PENANT_c013G11003 [Penicillium antarcticum]|uniref:Fungal-type protein kinase domain-containing protein n=1 Tax=Penicillium antarcticum TaxID=416450 RepID=A0A1V6Q4S3_9EURO|nr:hypothetical protein PENANT_c013G11003 [Penicillium antarcticum]
MSRLQGHASLRQALPPLCVGGNHTTTSTINLERYLGNLSPWKDFFDDVKAFEPEYGWSRRILRPALKSRPTDPELFVVGDEHGIQGRFQQQVGQVVGAVLDVQEVEIAFADFKAADISTIYPEYSHVPDVALISTNRTTFHHLKAIGELKTPWVRAHSLLKCVEDKRWLGSLLGQCIGYMLDLRVMHGFMSSYGETIFLRQVSNGNEWVIEYSPTVESSFVGSNEARGEEPPSVRECFMYLSSLAAKQPPVDNFTPRDEWIGQ